MKNIKIFLRNITIGVKVFECHLQYHFYSRLFVVTTIWSHWKLLKMWNTLFGSEITSIVFLFNHSMIPSKSRIYTYLSVEISRIWCRNIFNFFPFPKVNDFFLFYLFYGEFEIEHLCMQGFFIFGDGDSLLTKTK